MAGGSCPNIKVNSEKFLKDVTTMRCMTLNNNEKCKIMGESETGYVIYMTDKSEITIPVNAGSYRINKIETKDGNVKFIIKSTKCQDKLTLPTSTTGTVWWIEKI